MSKIMKDTLILLIITLIAGTGLGFVYNVTKDARQAQEEKTKNEAFKNVFPDADTFGEPLAFDEEKLNQFIADADQKTKTADKDNTNDDINATIDEIVAAMDASGNVLGYVITVTDKEAYDGQIQFSIGISNDGTVNGISFLSISETPGLGMKANEDSFLRQFENKNVGYFKYTKTGAAEEEAIDALSGATITSNAVTNGATAAIYCFDYITGGGEHE